ncbi:MAG: drug resistance transporter, EmrB/QacA subfamily [Acidimicrobiaceae bacterium]|nr:drug resistance transporter, EmrB/QacA subfamily [Acidimicrobiaceae bacterium]
MPSKRPQMSQKVAVSVVFVAAMFMSIMDTTIVNVALPTIGRDFHVAATSVSIVSIAFLVSLAVFIPGSGWLGDRFGGKRVLLTAIVIFTGASALCGIAQNMGELVASRILQGVGGGMLTPVGMAMLYRVFPPAERVRASSILTTPTALAPAAGPVLGGLLVSDLSWRWVFYVNVPIGIAAAVFGAVFLDSVPQKNPGRFDLGGFVLAGSGLGLLMYGVSEGPTLSWHSSAVLATIALGAVVLALLVRYELRVDQPLIDLRLLRNALFRIGTSVILLTTASLLGVLYVVTLFYQDGRGLSALGAGLSTFPEAIGVMVGAQLAARFVYPRLGPRRHVFIGNIGIALFIALLALVGPDTSLWWPRVLLFGMGLSLGQVFVPTQAASFATISSEATGRASTLFNAVRQLGGALGVAAFTTVVVGVGAVHVVGGHATPDLTAYHAAFLAAAAFAVLSAAAALWIRDSDAISTMPGRAKAVEESAATRSSGVLTLDT